MKGSAYAWAKVNPNDIFHPPTKEDKLQRLVGATSFQVVSDLLNYVDPDLREAYKNAIYDLTHTPNMCDSCEEALRSIDWNSL